MAKFFGKIGFNETSEVQPGRWVPQITEKDYYGDVLNVSKKYQTDDSINPNINIYNKISIVCDLYAAANLGNIIYVEWQGTKWSVKSIEFKRPRLIISLGGVYKRGDGNG